MAALSDKAGFLIVANLVKYAVGFLLPMALVRLLTKEDYGTYQQLLLIGGLALSIMVLGLPTSIYYFYHHVPERRRPTLIAQTSLLLAASAALAALAVWLLSTPLAERFNNPALTALMPVYALYLLFFIAGEHFIAVLIAQDRYAMAVGFEVGETVVRVVVLLLPVALGWGLPGVIVGTAVYAALRWVVRTALVFFGRDRVRAEALHAPFVGAQLGYGVPIALSALAGSISAFFNRAIVAMFFTPAQYAIYAVGALEIPLDTIFQASVFNVLRASLPPLIRDGRHDEVIRILRESVRKLALVMLPGFVFLYGFAPQFITTLFTRNYAESVDVFRIYTLLMPLNMFVLSPIPQVFGRTRINLAIVIASAFVMAGLSWVLLKTVGFYGPAIAVVATQYLQTALFFGAAVRLLRAPPARLLPLGALGKIALACAAALAVALLVADPTPYRLANLAFDAAAFGAAFLAAAAALGVFTAGDRQLVRRWLARVLPGRHKPAAP
jgi:O-antigen/teichoic acid export membrane protein